MSLWSKNADVDLRIEKKNSKGDYEETERIVGNITIDSDYESMTKYDEAFLVTGYNKIEGKK